METFTGLQDKMSRMEIVTYDCENFWLAYPDDRALNVTYGQTQNDVRETRNRAVKYLRLKNAQSLISEIDGHSRQKMQEFISVSTYAMEKINFAEKSALLEEILNTKLKAKLLLDFQTRSVTDFEQLRREIEINYLGKFVWRHFRSDHTHKSLDPWLRAKFWQSHLLIVTIHSLSTCSRVTVISPISVIHLQSPVTCDTGIVWGPWQIRQV